MNTLSHFLHAKTSQVFEWGTNDCCLFAADWAAALTGEDPMSDFRGRYSTPTGACRLWRREAGGYEGAGVSRLLALGWRESAQPVRGCIVLARAHKAHSTFGLWDGRHVFMTPEGPRPVALSGPARYFHPPTQPTT